MVNPIKETLNKSDITKEIKVFLDSKTFETKIEKIVKDRIKNEKILEDKILEITKNVISQLYKTLWSKRGFWMNNVSNKNS